MRRNGYAIDDEEYQPGVICVGAAIRDHNGAVVGAISASTPTMRANDEHLSLVREQVCSAVRALSAELGGPGTQARPPRGGRISRRRTDVRTARREDHRKDLPVPDTMRAWVLGDPGELKLIDKPVPVPKRAEVLVRIDAVAICATDLEIIWHGPPGLDPGRHAVQQELHARATNTWARWRRSAPASTSTGSASA